MLRRSRDSHNVLSGKQLANAIGVEEIPRDHKEASHPAFPRLRGEHTA
jgi:hypothetical protein